MYQTKCMSVYMPGFSVESNRNLTPTLKKEYIAIDWKNIPVFKSSLRMHKNERKRPNKTIPDVWRCHSACAVSLPWDPAPPQPASHLQAFVCPSLAQENSPGRRVWLAEPRSRGLAMPVRGQEKNRSVPSASAEEGVSLPHTTAHLVGSTQA